MKRGTQTIVLRSYAKHGKHRLNHVNAYVWPTISITYHASICTLFSVFFMRVLKLTSLAFFRNDGNTTEPNWSTNCSASACKQTTRCLSTIPNTNSSHRLNSSSTLSWTKPSSLLHFSIESRELPSGASRYAISGKWANVFCKQMMKWQIYFCCGRRRTATIYAVVRTSVRTSPILGRWLDEWAENT